MDKWIGQTIKEIRKATEEEHKSWGFEDHMDLSPVIVLDNGEKIYTMSDAEGNNTGVMCATDKDKSFYVGM